MVALPPRCARRRSINGNAPSTIRCGDGNLKQDRKNGRNTESTRYFG